MTDQSGRPPSLAEAAGPSPRAENPEGLWRLPPKEGREEEARRSDSNSLIFTTIVATVIGAMALIGLREKILGIAPRAAAPYAAVGLPVNVDGLAFARALSATRAPPEDAKAPARFARNENEAKAK